MYAEVEGQTVRVGDFVCFKRGVEQCGRVIKIRGTGASAVLNVMIEDECGDEFAYSIAADNCWIE